MKPRLRPLDAQSRLETSTAYERQPNAAPLRQAILNLLLVPLMLLDLLLGAYEAVANTVRRILGRDEGPTRLARHWAKVERWIARARADLDSANR